MADGSEYAQVISSLVKNELDQMNTAIPCTVVSYNNRRVSVRPSGEKRYPDGDSNPYPVLHNIRYVWPKFANGQAGVKGR